MFTVRTFAFLFPVVVTPAKWAELWSQVMHEIWHQLGVTCHGSEELPVLLLKPCGFGDSGGAEVHPVAWRQLAGLWLKARLSKRPSDPSKNVTNFSPHFRL